MSASNLSVLMVTPLDYRDMWNSTEHARVRYYGRKGLPTTLVHLRLSRREGFVNLVRDTLSFRTQETVEAGVRIVAVHPFFNYYSGLRAKSDATVARDGHRSLRHRLVRLLAPLAVLRDAFFTPCFVGVAIAGPPRRFDVCLGFGPWGGLVGLMLRQMGKVSLLVYQDRDYESGLMPDRLRRWYTGAVERFVTKRADLVICVGRQLAALRREQGSVQSSLIPGGIDWERFEAARQASGAGHTLVYVGTVSSWSGVEQNIRAMPLLLKDVPDARLLIVGSGLEEYTTFLKQLTAELGVTEAVEFAGSQPHERVPEFLSRAAVGLANSEPVPFRRYACPLKLIEFMAAGLPTIVTEGTEAADMVRHHQVGLVAQFNIESIADAMRRLLTDPDAHQQFRTNAIRESRGFDWNDLVAREHELIERMITLRKSGGRMMGARQCDT